MCGEGPSLRELTQVFFWLVGTSWDDCWAKGKGESSDVREFRQRDLRRRNLRRRDLRRREFRRRDLRRRDRCCRADFPPARARGSRSWTPTWFNTIFTTIPTFHLRSIHSDNHPRPQMMMIGRDTLCRRELDRQRGASSRRPPRCGKDCTCNH